MNLAKIADKIIENCFYLLFFLTPFVLTPVNYELFEYNKMMTVYGLTIIIAGSWIIKMIGNSRLILRKSPLDKFILLFYLSQIVSTYFSIDRHVSLWGYYSRFNGGLISTTAYFLLYFAFISNFPAEKINRLFKFIFFSGVLISAYGILEHFGYSLSCLIITGQLNTNCWVQDVQNRVFATIGQPNWLAAYLIVLSPVFAGMFFSAYAKTNNLFTKKNTSDKLSFPNMFIYFLSSTILYACILFTKSRSGFIAFWSVFILFVLYISLSFRQIIKRISFCISYFVIFTLITIVFGAPFLPLNRISLESLLKKPDTTTSANSPRAPSGDSIIDVGVTESGEIRRIVWKGALDIFKNNPLIGTGVETFAFSYYKFRPIEHNMTSEWDFLYNKAHNEYLNFAANTGILGLGSYLLFILAFLYLTFRKIRRNIKNNPPVSIMSLALLIGWVSILITNFFGFSVVVIQIYFYLIPAIILIMTGSSEKEGQRINPANSSNLSNPKDSIHSFVSYVFIFITVSLTLFFLLNLGRIWYADYLFSKGYHLSRSLEATMAYDFFQEAITLNNREPLYLDEISYPAAQLAVALNEEKQSTFSSQLKETAILSSNEAISISPNNINFWKTRTRVFYTLSEIEEKYLNDALSSIQKARDLSPTDPKIYYNLALLYDKLGKTELAYQNLEKTITLKPNYKEAYFALALFYKRDKNIDKAKEKLNFILKNIDQNDQDAKKNLEELK